jgi:glucokinase
MGGESSRAILASDLGGTNFRWTLRCAGRPPIGGTCSNVGHYASFNDLLRNEVLPFLPVEPHVTCCAVAGPKSASGRSAHVTNLKWSVRAKDMERLPLGRVHLMNDFEAVAVGLETVSSRELIAIGGGRRRAGDGVVVGPGTGLGVVFLSWTGERFIPKPTEAGHREWAARSDLEWEIRKYIAKKKRQANGAETAVSRVSYEDVVSGLGIRNLYEAIRSTCPELDPDSAVEKALVTPAGDVAAAVADQAGRGSPICSKTLDVFWDNLAVFVSDLALQACPSGVYIVGGVVKRNKEAFLKSRFRQTFDRKPPHEQMLAQTPVFLVNTTKELGVEGAAIKASELLVQPG